MASEKLFIDGVWRSAKETIAVEDPSTGKIFGELAAGSAADIDDAVRAASEASRGIWGRTTAAERGRVLARMSALVAAQADHLAELEARDVGKPLKQARADAVALARYLEFYAGACDKLHGETIPYLADYTVYTLREPHGVTAHIIPWNYPMQIIGRSVVAALAAGNATVLKPAEELSLTALAFARIAQEADLPAGALNVVTGTGEEAGAALASNPGIHHLSFTGSTAVGALVQAAADSTLYPSRWNSAENRHKSFSKTPISNVRCRSSSTPESRTPGKPVRPRRVFWFNEKSMLRFWKNSRRATVRCASDPRRTISTWAP